MHQVLVVACGMKFPVRSSVSCSVVSSSLQFPWTVASQAPLFMGFSREEYWSGLPFPSPGDLPNPEMEAGSLALQAVSLASEPLRKFPDQGSNLGPLHWECRVVATGSSGKFQISFIFWRKALCLRQVYKSKSWNAGLQTEEPMGFLELSREIAQVGNDTQDGSCGKLENPIPSGRGESQLQCVVTKRTLRFCPSLTVKAFDECLSSIMSKMEKMILSRVLIIKWQDTWHTVRMQRHSISDICVCIRYFKIFILCWYENVKLLSHVWLFVTPWTITVHGILQARILEWVAFHFSRGSS